MRPVQLGVEVEAVGSEVVVEGGFPGPVVVEEEVGVEAEVEAGLEKAAVEIMVGEGAAEGEVLEVAAQFQKELGGGEAAIALGGVPGTEGEVVVLGEGDFCLELEIEGGVGELETPVDIGGAESRDGFHAVRDVLGPEAEGKKE